MTYAPTTPVVQTPYFDLVARLGIAGQVFAIGNKECARVHLVLTKA